MGRWDNSNVLEYKGVNFGRRDLIETMSYDNAYCILEYMKYKYDIKKVKDALAITSNLIPFFVYIHEMLDDKSFSEISEADAEQYIYYACSGEWGLDVTIQTRKINAFYNFLIYINKAAENPFAKLASLYKKEKGRKYFFLCEEQIEKIKNIPSDYLKLYFAFTLSTSATLKQIRYLKWNNIDFENRVALVDEKILYFNEEVKKLLKNESQRRAINGLNDCGYVFRSHVEQNYNKDAPISKTTISDWCMKIGEYINVPNLKHNHIRHTTIQQLLSATGSVGMTSILTNHPFLTVHAKYFINDNVNNDLLQEYKDIWEL